MHINEKHGERDVAVLRDFIRENPFGVLTTAIKHPTLDTLQSTHIIWILEDHGDRTILRGHLGRGNPQSQAMIDSLKARGLGNGELEDDILILFTSPVHSYVTPRWMPGRNGNRKIAPTWQFSAVQVYGRARIIHSRSGEEKDETDEWCETMVTDLIEQEEGKSLLETGGEDDEEWTLDQMADSYRNMLLKGIVGLVVEVKKMEGRFKVGQDEADENWDGIVKGFKERGTELGCDMAKMMVERANGRPGCPV